MATPKREVRRRSFVGGVAAGVLAGCWPPKDDRARHVARGEPTMSSSKQQIEIFLCGDVMTGRGIDQVLRTPSDPRIHEPYVKDAREYVQLARDRNGPIPAPVDDAYIWGDALTELERVRTAVRIINLETAVTTNEDWESKGINYRMHPANVGCITAAKIDCCVVANNHALDWGRPGLVETLRTLHDAGVATAGAGLDLAAASAPVMLETAGRGRVAVVGLGLASSGIPPGWAARANRPGLDVIRELSSSAIDAVAARVARVARAGEIVVASIHWGPNWGYDITDHQQRLAHALIDSAGVDVVHGHSSHHPKGIEVHRGKPILYGCGDFINDYEGISGYDEYRGDLVLMYVVGLDARSHELTHLDMTPLQTHCFRLRHARPPDVSWLRKTLDREARRFGASVEQTDTGLALRW